jgi:hypothetical protein
MADQPPSVVDAEIRASSDLLGLPDAHQLDLLPGDRGPARTVQEYRGRGRPPGSANRANKDFRRFILSQHAHPGVALARTYDRPVELLAQELSCTLLEAYQLQQRAAIELLPYIEGKAPVTVNVQRRNDVVVIMPGAGTSDDELGAMQEAIAGGDEIDWATAEIADVAELLALPSYSGGPEQAVSSDQAE